MVFRGNFDAPAEAVWLEEGCEPVRGRLCGIRTQDQTLEPWLLDLEAQVGPELLVPEVWRNVLTEAGILISSAISGGTFAQRVSEAVQEAPGRCWLLLEPLSHVFSLPCPTGCGEPLTVLPQKRHYFFSPELCCRYACDLDQGRMILYDTRESLTEKIRLAEEAGFCGVVRTPPCP